jgi:hypothetical protein
MVQLNNPFADLVPVPLLAFKDLHQAIKKKNLDKVKTLVAAGACVNMVNKVSSGVSAKSS